MSAFEVNVTPNRNKTIGKAEKQPTDVFLAPFTAKAVVTFENVPVLKTARRILNIFNTTDEDLKVMLTRTLNPEYNMCLEWTSTMIPANGCKTLEMVWSPTKEIQCRETIQFTDNRNFRKDISVILKSIKKGKTGTKRFPTLSNSTGSVSKCTLKLKSQTSSNNLSNRKPNSLYSANSKTSLIQKQIQNLQLKKHQQNFRKSNYGDIRNQRILFDESELNFVYDIKSPEEIHKNKNKENIKPLATPENITYRFDNINFTPVSDINSIKVDCTPSSELDYLASLSTPVNIKSDRNIILNTPLAINFSPEFQTNFQDTEIPRGIDRMSLNDRNIKNTEKQSQQGNYRTQNIPKILIQNETECVRVSQDTYVEETKTISPGQTYIQDSILDMSSEPRKSLVPINNKTFDLKNQTASSENLLWLQSNENQEMNDFIDFNFGKIIKNQVDYVDSAVKKPSRLSSIAETEESFKCETLKKQNKISSSSPHAMKRDIKLIGTPLRKCSESLRDLSGKSGKGSMGAMGSMPDLNSMETLQSIEQNRYYYQLNRKSNSQLDLNTSPKVFTNTDSLNASNESCVSNAELCFNQSEIRAASSHFNLNEAKHYRSIKAKSPSIIKDEPKTLLCHKFKTPNNLKNAVSSSNNIEYIYKRNHNEIDSPSSSINNLMPRTSNVMAISPPKRTKYDNVFSIKKDIDDENDLFRVTTFKSIQPVNKKRFQKNLSLVRQSLTPRKIKDEPRQILYNSENFLQHYINPDPFAATTTLDPFLATTMYLDEESVNKYEIQFKKWLNALVTLPSELDANCEEKIDVGRLFNEVRNKELILAPTKEEQSMNYLTKSRMEALRSAAIKLFMGEEMRTACSKVAVYIKRGAIKIRQDRDLHLDVVMQRTILELLLSFNPLWLRLGLEVVFGEVIHLHSNSDIVGLSTFILNRLFRDKFIERKYSRAYTLSEEYKAHMKSFTLQKILFLLLFLDKAKINRIIQHNPCLFVKQSQHKETKEILLRMSSELLASVGDITRELRRLGYVLSHKQCYIDEFDYAFKNLAVDLRDGIRFTRIMEIILLRDNLTNQLRCPAISRLQRIHNVNLALKALSEADFQLKGQITAYNIVDGHREKTLSFLWQIIYKFRSPKFIAAAIIIQQWWRKKWLNVVICRRIKVKEDKRRYEAATKIQAFYKGLLARKYVVVYKRERVNAAICLQKYYRRYLERKRFTKTVNSIIYIQRWYRNQKLVIYVRSRFLELKFATRFIEAWYRRINLARKLELAAPIIRQVKAEAKLRHTNAIIIQRCIKSFIIRKKFIFLVNNILEHVRKNNLENRSAAKIQAFIKMCKIRKEFLLKKSSTCKIQLFWRSYKLRKIERAMFLGKREAALEIQSYFRNYLIKKTQRNHYMALRRSTILIQTRFRAKRLGKIERENYTKLRNAVIVVQQRFKTMLLMRKTRNEYKILLKTTLMIQQQFRANKLCRSQTVEYQRIKRSTIIIQSNYRALAARRKFKILKEKVIFIQRKLRATILARKLRYDFVTLQYQAILMQQRFRANSLMKHERSRYELFKRSTIIVQRRFRAMFAMKKQRMEYLTFRKAVKFIQIKYRANYLMRKEKKYFLKLKYSALIIQRRYRAIKLMQSNKNDYQMLLRSTVKIQRRFRANLLMKNERNRYLALRNSVIIIQSRFKALINMRVQKEKYMLMKKSAIIIQRKYVAYKLMKIEMLAFKTLLENIIKIQQNFRANRLMKLERSKYLALRKSSIIIQVRWRGLLEMRKQKYNFMLIKKSTIFIQQKYKSYKLMRIQQLKYKVLRKNVINIQRKFRAHILMKRDHSQYLKMRNAILNLQRKWRATIKMREQRQKYLLLKKSTIFIQQKYRANKLMQIDQTYYENLYIAVLSVQQMFRANYLMKREKAKYTQIRNSAIKIQLWFRASFEMRKQRNHFLLIKSTCKKIQEKFRAQKLMRRERNNFLMIKRSVVIIQHYFKATILMRKFRSNYLQLKHVTCTIQRRFQNKKKMQLERSKYLQMKKSAVLIQRTFRSYCQVKVQRNEYLKLRDAAIIIQQRYRAKLQMYIERKTYLEVKSSIERFQVYCRGFLARKRFIAAMTPEMKEFIKQRKAAKTIQRFWRGYLVRKKWRNVRLKVIRENIKELKGTATACNTVRYKITSAVKFLNGRRYNIQEELSVLLRLEKLSRTVPHFLMDHSNFIATFCYSIMAQAIRSEIDKQLIELCSRIILNLARYNSTTANTFQENGLVTIAQMLLRWCDKDCGIFNTLCTLVWIFSHCSNKNKIIRAFMTTPEAIYMLRETKKLVLRKEKMRQNVRRLSIPSISMKATDFSPKTLPSLEPDFGIIQGKPYIFVSSVFAFEVVLNKLKIKI